MEAEEEILGWLVPIIVLGFFILFILYFWCPCKPRTKLTAGSDAIAPADNGWGPYKCILAVKGEELIPGKLATSKNVAFYTS